MWFVWGGGDGGFGGGGMGGGDKGSPYLTKMPALVPFKSSEGLPTYLILDEGISTFADLIKEMLPEMV